MRILALSALLAVAAPGCVHSPRVSYSGGHRVNAELMRRTNELLEQEPLSNAELRSQLAALRARRKSRP